METVEGLHQPRPHGAAVIGPEGHRDDLEPVAVVALEHLHRQGGGDMLVKIGRQISDADPVMVVALARP